MPFGRSSSAVTSFLVSDSCASCVAYFDNDIALSVCEGCICLVLVIYMCRGLFLMYIDWRMKDDL